MRASIGVATNRFLCGLGFALVLLCNPTGAQAKRGDGIFGSKSYFAQTQNFRQTQKRTLLGLILGAEKSFSSSTDGIVNLNYLPEFSLAWREYVNAIHRDGAALGNARNQQLKGELYFRNLISLGSSKKPFFQSDIGFEVFYARTVDFVSTNTPAQSS